MRTNGTAINANKNKGNNLVELFEVEAVPHFTALKRLALYLVRNQTEAEDLVQETYVQALKSFDRYQAGTNCRAWLSKILVNKRAQWLRSNLRYQQLDETTHQIESKISFDSNLHSYYMGKKVSFALSKLPPKSKNVIWLSLVEELTYREIADRLQIPIGTVMSRIHRARKMLSTIYHLPTGTISASTSSLAPPRQLE